MIFVAKLQLGPLIFFLIPYLDVNLSKHNYIFLHNVPFISFTIQDLEYQISITNLFVCKIWCQGAFIVGKP